MAANEQATAEPEAMKLIAHAADGSVRDGLSLLDQAIARGNGTITASDVKDMLGLADRAHSMTLCRSLLRGVMKDALDTFTLMQQSGSDPLQILQDMCDFVHLLTRGQVIPDFAKDDGLPEYDRQLLTDLSDIKLPALARAWQILLKGISEVQSAPDPAQAAEMVLIRLAYASELPLPGDLIKQLRDMTTSATTGSTSGPSQPGNEPRARLSAAGGVVMPVTALSPRSILETDVTPQSVPTSYKDLVALFNSNREGALHAQLYGNIHPVRFETGILEIRIGSADAPTNLASRLAQCLTEWTGQRWMVSISDRAGEPTLAEQDAGAEKKRHQRAAEHPLMQAVVKTFPGARLTALRQKATPPITSAEVVPADDADSDTPIELTEFED